MKKMMIVIAVLAAAGTAHAAFTYTYGPGTNFASMGLEQNESMLVNGGGGRSLTLFYNSYARIESTTPLSMVFPGSGIWEMQTAAYSSATVLGGEFNVIYVVDYSHLTMSGGKANALYGELYLPIPAAPQDKYIQFICKSWDYNSTTENLAGIWGDDSTFNIHLMDTAGYPTTFDSINFTIVPEPLSLGLLVIGGLLIRRYTHG